MSGSATSRNSAVYLRANLPPELAAGANLVSDLIARGALGRIADEFRVRRKAGGFVGLDAVIFLMTFFASGWTIGGMRGFLEGYRPFMAIMAALAGRARMMSQSSLSRLLDVVPVDEVRALSRSLLLDHIGAVDVLRSPAVQTSDTQGNRWHVFDFDPNREVYRRRELARPESRPTGERRTHALAAPGHRGRKRGEVVMTQGLVVHAGAGLWIDAAVQPGNGDPRELLGGALEAVGACCDALGHPRARALMRTDGEFRGVPSFAAAARAGVGFLTRLARYDLLDDPAVRARLHAAQWERVDDAGAGPIRIATDLGTVVLEAGENTLQNDGTPFAPVDVRVVVSCYRCASDVPDEGRRGHRIGDSVFELYGLIGVAPEDWSAGDLVSAYYGRCGQENRFAQVDREFSIDRTFSFQPGGHLLALVCALATWNWQIIQALKAHPLPAPEHPRPRVQMTADAPDELRAAPFEPGPEAAEPNPVAGPLAAIATAMDDAAVRAALRERGFTWNAGKCAAERDDGEVWDLSSALVDHGTPSLRFARLGGRSEERRNIQVKIPESALHTIQAAFASLRRDRPKASLRDAISKRPVVWRRKTTYTLREEPAFHPAPAAGFAIGWPHFVPARARQHTIRARVAVRAEVAIPQPSASERHPFMARDPDDLRRRRWSWAARVAKFAAPTGTTVALMASPTAIETMNVRG